MADGGDLSELISTLERIASDVKQACDESPQKLDNLESTIATTARLIDGANGLPKEERQNWLSDLATLANPTSAEHESPGSVSVTAKVNREPLLCNCPIDDFQFRGESNPLPTKKHVRCMHGCNLVFCSATCRKKRARTHRITCKALRQKRILSAIGLTGDEEMF